MIATIYGDGGVQLYAVGRDEHRCGTRLLGEHGPQRRLGQTELDAGGHGLVGGLALIFEVLGKIAMQMAEHAQKVRGRELLDWQEACIVIADQAAKASISSRTNAGKGPACVSTRSRNARQCSRTTAAHPCVLRGT